jgi:DNA-binding beta-propeller fold protein YncE
MQWPRQNNTNGEILISDVDCWGLAMDNEGFLYVSDCKNHEVRRWRPGDTNGVIIEGGNGQGNRLDQLKSPTYIFVDDDHTVYVSDTNNHRVMK